MKTIRTMTILTAAVVGLVTSLPAQQTDSAGMDMDDTSGMQMGAMPMMNSGDAGVGHVLRHRDRVELTEEQVRALRELEEETRAERRTAMKRMREAHEAMRAAALREREQVQQALSPEQRQRLPETSEAQSTPMRKDCPMRNRDSGAEPDSTSSAGGES